MITSSGEINSEEKVNEEKPTVVKNATGLQRLKLEKLMKNPDKPVVIPDRQKEKKQPHVPDFVRNVMGSSAGAGSGEFHVYRHLRRKEYARQKYIQEKGEKALLDEQYQEKLEENKRIAEERTAKKRAKRLKLKEKLKRKKMEGQKLENKNKQKVKSNEESSQETDENGNGEISEKEGFICYSDEGGRTPETSMTTKLSKGCKTSIATLNPHSLMKITSMSNFRVT